MGGWEVGTIKSRKSAAKELIKDGLINGTFRETMALVYQLLALLLLSICSAESADPLGQYCGANTKTTRQISLNIDVVLAKLVQGTAQNGFSATSYGNAKDQVYGLAQCRGDVSSDDCLSCIQDASKEIRKRCPDQADARIWYDYCFLRYNTENFIGEVDTSYGIFYYNVANVTDPDAFNEKLGALMDRIKSQAVAPINKGLGKGESKLSPFETLYALVQCTRDLSQLSCAQCLAIAIGNFPRHMYAFMN
ncbi:hypothetical protein RJ640_025350 [Escallonia rubra]|uniref:Gnk2-homologous domain-containing protein n=1 Tax=Escallonia rubra TaxID=112253 RepID=A0AA88U5J6_9ASTE|nr:hypothetical protein RJ640_025350 [Escallonia rubra]